MTKRSSLSCLRDSSISAGPWAMVAPASGRPAVEVAGVISIRVRLVSPVTAMANASRT
jgi:hypothetical protein